MIALLRGRVVGLDGDEVVLDVAGVGYQVHCHQRTVASLHGEGAAELTLHVHTSVSDDAIRLFGFTSREELRLFQLLIGVERIGPRVALGFLGRADLATLVRAIRGQDVALVATVPGVGRKTAERVILELSDKLDALAVPGAAAVPTGGREAASAVDGLVGLGFTEAAARSAVAEVLAGGAEDDAARLVSAALRRLDTVGAAR